VTRSHAYGLLVVGSGPAGVSAAEAFREHDPESTILILSNDPELPYARPPLSKEYLQGESDDISLHPPQWYDDRSIERRHHLTVDLIDVEHRTVTAGDQQFRYRTLVLATGAAPVPLPVAGGEHALALRSATDAARLRSAAAQAETAVVIGAGFIGCEAAASLAAQGISVTLIAPEAAPQIKRLGQDAGERLRDLVENTGVRFRGGVEVTAIDSGPAQKTVQLDDGSSLEADLVLAATGVAPQSDLAETAGLEVRESRIVVGSDMRTSAPGVYAAGDVALAYNETAGRHLAVEHWQDADDQGTIAGTSAAGVTAAWDAVPGFWSSIGTATVKYHAWGDGHEHSQLVDHGGDGFTVWYSMGQSDVAVGVLTYNSDDDYDTGGTLIKQRSPIPTHVR
jgi:NADPH-dependent 2,4-dienoyl-CoA reductase/sulfur reductase-like enzyme